MAIVDGSGLPLTVHMASSSPHEITLVEATVAATLTYELTQRLIGDRTYDSDSVDDILAGNNIEFITPNRRKRQHATQDGRPLKRCKRRWRFNASYPALQAVPNSYSTGE